MYQFHDIAVGAGGGTTIRNPQAAMLRPAFAPQFVRPPAKKPFLQSGLRARLAEINLVVDLGQNIGSLEWLRGFVVCAGLCYSAYSLAPGFQPLPGIAPPALGDVQWEESRSLAISPLAYGADTGRRMAATDAVEPLTDTPERPSIDLLASLGPNDAFGRALQRAGLSRTDADQVTNLVGQAIPIGTISSGTTANLTLGRRDSKQVRRPLDALSFRAAFDLKIEVRRVAGRLVLHRIPIAVDNTPARFQGRVGPGLYRAARAAGVPARLVESYIRAVATQTDIGSVRANDRFDIIVEHRRAATGETESGRLLYAGLDRSAGKDLQLMQWEQNGSLQWFEASGVGRASGTLQRPVPGTVSSNFGMRRHPILGYSRMHKGMDFKAGYGTPILASSDGRVVRAGWAGGYGKQVRLTHSDGFATSYSHMSRIVAQPGQFVRQGQVIGYVGSTGLSTGPHLHYELYRNSVPINPASVKYTSQAKLSGPALAGFRAKLRRLLGVRPGAASAEDMETAARETVRRPDRA